jgi:asparagine synthase (glutamine-hydrolysing)
MCGLVALIGRSGRPVERPVLARMSEVLRHRGPDGDGLHVEGSVGLAHRRLAILDPAAGAQPMTVEGVTLVHNGEVYNFVELRRDLQALGRTFHTGTDTEVVLHAYLAWGPSFVERLNGMFAFVLVDPARRLALVARDRFGVKPLYLHRAPDRLLFASEIKALLVHPEVPARPNPAALHDYVTFQYCLGDATLFAGIRKVLPGHVLTIDLDSLAVTDRAYWQPDFEVDLDHTESYFVDQLRDLLIDTVGIQMRADVPVGAYLSGGLDSSLVTTLASRFVPGPIQTFTGAFDEGPEFDESPYARLVADAVGASTCVIRPTETDFVATLPRLVWHMDEPSAGPGLFPQYMVSREAAQRVKVCLGGQGGDEIFGGYARYVVAYLEQALKGAIFSSNEEGEHIVSLSSILPNLPFLKAYVPMLTSFWARGAFADMDRRYFALIDRSEGQLDGFSADFRRSHDREAAFARFQAVFQDPHTRSYYNKMVHYDLVSGLPALLHVEDRVSMAVSLESRVPLLDHRLVELVTRMPPAMKFRGAEMKYILKRAIRDLLPPAVVDRKDKMGFPVPLHLWARGRAGHFFRDVLLSPRCRQRGLFEPGAVETLLSEERAFGRRLWGLMNLELWCQTFLDRPADTALTA